jgi:hypothetical protein
MDVTIKCAIWDVMPCSLVGFSKEQAASYLHDRRESQANILLSVC